MPIEFRCPSCGKLLRTPDASAGKKGKCPHCQTVNDIPLASTAPSTPAPETPLSGAPAPGSPDGGPKIGRPQPERPLSGAPAPGAPSASGGDLFANLPSAAPTPTPTSPVDLFGSKPASTPAPSSGAPDLFANLPGSTPAPASGSPDLFSNLPGASSPSAPTDLFGGTGSSAGAPSPPMDKAQALFADPFGPGVGGGSSYGSGGGGGGDMGGGYASAPASNPYGAPSYAASQPSYGGGYQSGMQPHRGGLILTLGIVALVVAIAGVLPMCCCGVLGVPFTAIAGVITLATAIPAGILGNVDLKKMKSGVMDPSGQGMTMTGLIMGIVSVVLIVIVVVLVAALFAFGIGMSAMQQNQRPRF